MGIVRSEQVQVRRCPGQLWVTKCLGLPWITQCPSQLWLQRQTRGPRCASYGRAVTTRDRCVATSLRPLWGRLRSPYLPSSWRSWNSAALQNFSDIWNPFDLEETAQRKHGIIEELRGRALELHRAASDRTDDPIDCRFLSLLSETVEDPDVTLGSFATRVRAGFGADFYGYWLFTLQRGSSVSRGSQIRWTTPRQRPTAMQSGDETVRQWQNY